MEGNNRRKINFKKTLFVKYYFFNLIKNYFLLLNTRKTVDDIT